MDPLSITASVASLVGGVASTVLCCKKLIAAYKDAPRTLSLLDTESRSVQMSLSYVQLALTRDADKLEPLLSEGGLLANNFEICLTGCSVAFTDLSREIGNFPQPQDGVACSWSNRIRQLWNEQAMKDILERIHTLSTELQTLHSILQTESLARIEELLRHQRPSLQSIRQDVESAASIRFDKRTELARQNSKRFSIVASTLGTKEFSFDNILINSTAYRRQYNAWRHRPSISRQLSPNGLVDNIDSISLSGQDGDTVLPESEWLIDLSDPIPGAPGPNSAARIHSDLDELVGPVSHEADDTSIGSSTDFIVRSHSEPGDIMRRGLHELDDTSIEVLKSPAEYVIFPRDASGAVCFPDGSRQDVYKYIKEEFQSLGQELRIMTPPFEGAVINARGGFVNGKANVANIQTPLYFHPDVKWPIDVSRIHLSSYLTKSALLTWQLSHCSNFAAVGEFIAAESAIWSRSKPIQGLDNSKAKIAVISPASEMVSLLDSESNESHFAFVWRTRSEEVSKPLWQWLDFSYMEPTEPHCHIWTSWMAHKSLGRNCHRNVTVELEEIGTTEQLKNPQDYDQRMHGVLGGSRSHDLLVIYCGREDLQSLFDRSKALDCLSRVRVPIMFLLSDEGGADSHQVTEPYYGSHVELCLRILNIGRVDAIVHQRAPVGSTDLQKEMEEFWHEAAIFAIAAKGAKSELSMRQEIDTSIRSSSHLPIDKLRVRYPMYFSNLTLGETWKLPTPLLIQATSIQRYIRTRHPPILDASLVDSNTGASCDVDHAVGKHSSATYDTQPWKMLADSSPTLRWLLTTEAR